MYAYLLAIVKEKLGQDRPTNQTQGLIVTECSADTVLPEHMSTMVQSCIHPVSSRGLVALVMSTTAASNY